MRIVVGSITACNDKMYVLVLFWPMCMYAKLQAQPEFNNDIKGKISMLI